MRINIKSLAGLWITLQLNNKDTRFVEKLKPIPKNLSEYVSHFDAVKKEILEDATTAIMVSLNPILSKASNYEITCDDKDLNSYRFPHSDLTSSSKYDAIRTMIWAYTTNSRYAIRQEYMKEAVQRGGKYLVGSVQSRYTILKYLDEFETAFIKGFEEGILLTLDGTEFPVPYPLYTKSNLSDLDTEKFEYLPWASENVNEDSTTYTATTYTGYKQVNSYV